MLGYGMKRKGKESRSAGSRGGILSTRKITRGGWSECSRWGEVRGNKKKRSGENEVK